MQIAVHVSPERIADMKQVALDALAGREFKEP